MDILSQRYAAPILSRLYQLKAMHGYSVMKQDLRDIVTTSSTLNTVLKLLQTAGLIQIGIDHRRRKTYKITLTDQGQALAEKLPSVQLNVEKVEETDAEEETGPLLNYLQDLQQTSTSITPPRTVRLNKERAEENIQIMINIPIKEKDWERIPDLIKKIKDWYRAEETEERRLPE